MAICRPFGDKWQSKTLFQTIFDQRSSIIKSVYDCRLPGLSSDGHRWEKLWSGKYNKLTGKINATIQFCQVRHVVHKHELHELTVTRTLSEALGLFEFIHFCLSGMLANTCIGLHGYFKCWH